VGKSDHKVYPNAIAAKVVWNCEVCRTIVATRDSYHNTAAVSLGKLYQCPPPTLAIMSHMGRNTPRARTNTMPPTNTMRIGSTAELRFFTV
jgi:hypothetical protein